MSKKSNKKTMDAVLHGSVEWSEARLAAYKMLNKLSGEVADLQSLTEVSDAYSPIAWLAICRHLRTVTDGMTVMRLLAQGKTPEQIAKETGISTGSIAAYKAWNTMYKAGIKRGAERAIRIKGRTAAEQRADIEFLRACGIGFEVVERD